MPPINLCRRRPGDKPVQEMHGNPNYNYANLNTKDIQSDDSTNGEAAQRPRGSDILKDNMFTSNKYMTEPKSSQDEREINKMKMDRTHKYMNEPMLCREEIDRHLVKMYINKKRVQTVAKSGSKKDKKEVEELYPKRKFVADSVTSITATRTKVTANGEMRTDPVEGVNPRHLTASPTLPSLRERTSKSKNAELYDLSMMLQENETSCKEEQNPKIVVFEKETSSEMIASSRKRFLRKDRTKKETYVAKNIEPNLSDKKEEAKEAFVKKNDKPNISAMPEKEFFLVADKKRGFEKAYIEKYEKPNLSAMPEEKLSNKPKPKKSEEATEKPVTKVTPREKETEFVAYSSRPESSPSQITSKKCLDPEVYGDVKYFKEIAGEADMALTKSFDHSPRKVRRPISISKPKTICKPKTTSFSSWAAECIQNIVNAIDHYSAYKFIILFGISFYLWYILCYDVNENVAEEWRYISIMKKSGTLMKVFYYVMRKMRIPIF